MSGAKRPLASDTALVLAAGLGKRMRPLTASQPKPMVRIAGKPLIDHALDRLAEAGIARAVVNVHYLADALEAHIRHRQPPVIEISDERGQLLETGGAMVKAQGRLTDPFFCLNSDTIWLDGPKNAFAELSDLWNAQAMDALLLLIPHKRGAQLSPVGAISTWMGAGKAHAPPLWADRAVHLHRHPAGLASACCAMHPTGPFSTNLLVGPGDRRRGACSASASPAQWFDVGTPAAIRPTEEALTHG